MLYFLKIIYFNNVTICLLIFLLISCLALILKIRKLKKEIDDIRENRIIAKRIIYDKENTIPMKNLSEIKEPIKNNTPPKIISMPPIKEEDIINIEKENKAEPIEPEIEELTPKVEKIEAEEPNPIEEEIIEPETIEEELIDIDNQEFNLDDLIQKKDNNSYLEEISKKIQEEIEKPIDLTDFEQEEEQDAIISYKELLNNKEKNSNKDTKEFIEELKKLRNSL